MSFQFHNLIVQFLIFFISNHNFSLQLIDLTDILFYSFFIRIVAVPQMHILTKIHSIFLLRVTSLHILMMFFFHNHSFEKINWLLSVPDILILYDVYIFW